MVLACFALISQIGAMVLLISPEWIELRSCACAHIEALKDGNGWFYPNNAGDPSEKEQNAANLSSDGGGLICP